MSAAPPVAQERLAELLADRVEWVTGSRTLPETRTADTAVLVLLRSLDLADLVHGALEFAAALDPAEAAAWRQAWTRTRFLFGNPANLPRGTRARVVAPGGTAAWLGPFPDTRLPGLARLLKPVTGELPALAGDVLLPGDGPRRVVSVAVEGLTLVDYLVHLHHTLAEAVLLGRLAPGDPLRIRHRPVIGAEPAQPAYARVLSEPGDPGRLRLYTWLS